MVLGRLLSRLAGHRPADPAAGRLEFSERPDVLYAIGDVHGRLDLLQEVEARIVADASAFPGDRRIVMLGDYVDRGPNSAGVLDHLTAPPPAGFQRHCVLGNHEVMMLRFVSRGRHFNWLGNGGYETLHSYGISPSRIDRAQSSSKELQHLLSSYIPDEHISFLQGLNRVIGFPGCDFVHFPPGASGGDADDREQQLARSFDLQVDPKPTAGRVFHGHRVVEHVSLDGRDVNLDTGAYFTGRLTVARLSKDDEVTIL